MARSNRQLTQFAVDKVRQYLVLGPDGLADEAAGNTRVLFFACCKCQRKSCEDLPVWQEDHGAGGQPLQPSRGCRHVHSTVVTSTTARVAPVAPLGSASMASWTPWHQKVHP